MKGSGFELLTLLIENIWVIAGLIIIAVIVFIQVDKGNDYSKEEQKKVKTEDTKMY